MITSERRATTEDVGANPRNDFSHCLARLLPQCSGECTEIRPQGTMPSEVTLNSGARMPTIAYGTGTKWFHREGAPDQDDALEAALLGDDRLDCTCIVPLVKTVGKSWEKHGLGRFLVHTKVRARSRERGVELMACSHCTLADALESGVRHIDMAGAEKRGTSAADDGAPFPLHPLHTIQPLQLSTVRGAPAFPPLNSTQRCTPRTPPSGTCSGSGSPPIRVTTSFSQTRRAGEHDPHGRFR